MDSTRRECDPIQGGVAVYCDILEALKAPKKTEEQQELLEWLEEGYDPERFDLETVNRWLAGMR